MRQPDRPDNQGRKRKGPGTPSPFGPNPWQQTSWDWRAAGNFIGGGLGSGLIVITALSIAPGMHVSALLLTGMALMGLGLLCVWLEIGRPLRALHVFFNPRTSWMTREAFVAPLVFASAFGMVLGWQALAPLAALAALAFAYCCWPAGGLARRRWPDCSCCWSCFVLPSGTPGAAPSNPTPHRAPWPRWIRRAAGCHGPAAPRRCCWCCWQPACSPAPQPRAWRWRWPVCWSPPPVPGSSSHWSHVARSTRVSP